MECEIGPFELEARFKNPEERINELEIKVKALTTLVVGQEAKIVALSLGLSNLSTWVAAQHGTLKVMASTIEETNKALVDLINKGK